MAGNRRVLNASQPIVNDGGYMAQAFQEWQALLTRRLPIRGTGSPEGVVSAPEDSVYIDEAGAVNAKVYTKIFASIGGDPKQGWEL